jgi:hypothetical protein
MSVLSGRPSLISTPDRCSKKLQGDENGLLTLSTLIASDWVELASNCSKFRMFPRISRVCKGGLQFESDLGHSISPGQRPFVSLLLTKLDFLKSVERSWCTIPLAMALYQGAGRRRWTALTARLCISGRSYRVSEASATFPYVQRTVFGMEGDQRGSWLSRLTRSGQGPGSRCGPLARQMVSPSRQTAAKMVTRATWRFLENPVTGILVTDRPNGRRWRKWHLPEDGNGSR